MADLTAQQRKNLPTSDFAGAGRTFPVENADHARAAISGASRAEDAGNISASRKASIDAIARAMLKK